MNGWLDPSQVGGFDRNRTIEIRSTLTIEDMPEGIPGATEPTQEDLRFQLIEYPISAGDTMVVEIHQLRQRLVTFARELAVDVTGQVNLPVLGYVQAAGLTPREFEQELVRLLSERNILREPEVTVDARFLQEATYQIFGIGVSAANNAPLRAGTFPMRRPDLRLLDAINQVGGLNEFVTDIYIFRSDEVASRQVEDWAPVAEGMEAAPPMALPPVELEPAPFEVTEPTDAEPAEAEPAATEPEADEDTPTAVNEEQLAKDVAALLEVVESAKEPYPPAATAEADTGDAEAEVPAELEVDPVQEYIWVNGEFVLNPAYEKLHGEREPVPVPAWDAPEPAVDWARIAGEATYRVIRVSADSLRAGDPESNIYIRGGDVIRITSGEIGVYYMMGQVNRVGAYGFNNEPITLKGAIAAAGGLTGLAWPDRCTVYRRIGQREQMIQVNLDRIFAGKDPDFFLRRSDVVNVGTHPFAPFLQRIRAFTLPNPIANVGYTFQYSRNFADLDSYGAKINPANVQNDFPNLFP